MVLIGIIVDVLGKEAGVCRLLPLYPKPVLHLPALLLQPYHPLLRLQRMSLFPLKPLFHLHVLLSGHPQLLHEHPYLLGIVMLVGDLIKGLALVELDSLQALHLLGKLSDQEILLFNLVFQLSVSAELLLILKPNAEHIIVSLECLYQIGKLYNLFGVVSSIGIHSLSLTLLSHRFNLLRMLLLELQKL